MLVEQKPAIIYTRGLGRVYGARAQIAMLEPN
ncbi:MAG: hypothetical protein UT08_C0010G0001 [Candidatus Woesebacteria bacterium GW2011_GWB1_38_8]|uniref:Uncharacterized protein n=1 Tax=Candidatus Woesebacteria bacterium GW2011_GWB1_38_8 TaxID=1618570 RepID=A0A0G0NGP3_9BACT|nr:MAG: hypothetical protein UT08_C0010G0001 [Candidatus Woesebacteria bacterium GW2011_GWB1_38_8]